MGHGITTTDNMFSVREMPWHNLVEPLPDYPTREEAQQIAHPWEPIEVPVYRAVPQIIDGEPVTTYEQIPGSKGIERSDNGDHLGVVNETLGIVTNNDLWDVAEAVAHADGGGAQGPVQYETAGSLDGGRKVWALLRFTEPLQISGDPHGATIPFFALQNSHDGTGSFRGQAINTRIVCANTSSAADTEAKRSGYEFTFRHSRNVRQRVEEAKAAVSLWREQVTMWQTAMEHLLTVHVSNAQLHRFVEEFHPMPAQSQISDRVRGNVEKARGELTSILDGATCADVRNTAYGLTQAGIEWSQHYRSTKGKDDRTRMESHFKRAMLTTNRLGHDTMALALEVAAS